MTSEGPVGLGDTEYARRTKALINLIGEIRALGGEGELELPRIAVIGNQSAGKSSLIEAISGITVPRATGTCTRCPMECRLKQSDSRWQCQVLLRIEADARGRQRPKTESKFGPIVYDTDELERMLRRAQLAILNPSIPPEAFVDFDLDSLKDDVPPLGSNEQLGFSANVVCLDVSGPDVPDLSFIDLPGIISNVADPKDHGNIEAINRMVMTHIKGRGCLILLTITMRDDIDNQSAAFIAKTVDPNGERTIGVLTKPDTLQLGEEKTWKDILEGRRHPLAHGYYITKQPSPAELQDNITHKEARRRESDFFKYHGTWSTCDSSTRFRIGTAKLGQSLSKLLSQRIDISLPDLRAQVGKQLKATENELVSLPARLVYPPSMEIIILVSTYLGELNRYVQGGPGFEDLIQICTPAYTQFAQNIFKTAPNIIAKVREKIVEESDDDTDSETTQGAQEPIYLDDLRSRIERSITRELPHNVPFSAKVTSILDCFVSWEALSLEALDTVFTAAQERALSLLDKHFARFSYSSLDEKVEAIVLEELIRCKNEVSTVLTWMVDLENPPYTQNEHYFSSYRDKYLTEYKKQRSKKEKEFNFSGTATTQALTYLRAAGYNIEASELVKLEKPDPYEREMIVAAEVRSYFQVAYKRIIDNVPRIIDHDFVRKLADRIQKALYSQLQIGTEEGLELAARLMADDPSMALRREELEAKTARLKDISAKLYGSL